MRGKQCYDLIEKNKKGHNKMKKMLLLVVSLFIAFQMMADIASLRILSIWGMSVDGGTLIYPLTFVARDFVHRLSNKIIARQVVITAAFVNLLMVGLFWLVANLSPDLNVGEQVEFGIVLMPAWRIVIASIVAEIVSGLMDGELYELWGRIRPNSTWQKAIFSNLFSIPADSIVFCLLAFYGTMPIAVIGSIILSNIIIKFIMAGVFTPIAYVRTKS